MIDNTDAEQIERLNARVSELLREQDGLREALQECLREHGGFTIKGECERKARSALASAPQPVAPRENLGSPKWNEAVRLAAQPAAPLGGREEIAKIIDPDAFVLPKYPTSDDAFWRGQKRQSALSKADAILPLSQHERVGDGLLAKLLSHSAVNEAMQDSWNDICSDTGCHPFDIEHGKGKTLTFSPHHWANQIAKRLFLHGVKIVLESDAALVSDRAAVIEECAKIADRHAAGWTLTAIGLACQDTAEEIAKEIRALAVDAKGDGK